VVSCVQSTAKRGLYDGQFRGRYFDKGAVMRFVQGWFGYESSARMMS